MKNKCLIAVFVVVVARMVFGSVICSGDSASVAIDSRTEPVTSSVLWNASWIGGDVGATVVITDNGVEVKRTTGTGEFSLSGIGRRELKYMTYIGGVVQDEVYETTVYNGWKYVIQNGGIAITETTQKAGEVLIPSEIDSYRVTAIGENVFSGCSEITRVVIPESVTNIGNSAFSDCSGLISVSLPGRFDGNLSESVFAGCPGSLSYEYRYSYLDVGFDANGGIEDEPIRSVAEGAAIGVLPSATKEGCSLMGWYTEQAAGEQIDEATKIWMPVTYFAHWQANKYILVFDANGGVGGVTNEQTYASKVVAPEVLREGYTFIGWNPEVGETVPASNVTYTAQWRINQYTVAFDANGGIGGMTNEQEYASEIVAPVVQREGCTFEGWLPSVEATVPASNVMYRAKWKVWSATVDSADMTLSALYPNDYANITNVVLSAGITEIPSGFFSGCRNLKSVAIPDTVASIGSSAFSECSSLEGVTIPNGVTNIGRNAFSGCSGLTSITIPDSVTSIGNSSFYGCSGLTSVTVPNSVTNIGASAFSGCSGLEEITLPFVGWCRGSLGAFGYIFGRSYYTGSTATYQTRSYYYIPSKLRNVVVTDETTLGYDAFYNCSTLTNVTIDVLTTVGDKAFVGCNNLSSREDGYKVVGGWIVGYSDDAVDVIFDVDELRGIAGGALEGCTALRSLEFSDKALISSIGAAALKGCTELRSLVLPQSLTTIGDEAFMGCSYLSDVIIPGSVKSVGVRAFKNCTGFTNAQIEYGVESLGVEAFYGDWQIMEVDIPSTVKSIGKDAFGGDSSIIRIGVRGDIRTIADIFSNYKLIREATVKEGTGAIVDGLFTNCTQLADVHFFGNCPRLANNGVNLYKGAKSSVKTYVSQDSTGWDGTPGSHQLPQAWPLSGDYRRSIAYWDVPTYLVEFDSNGGTLGVQSTYQYSECPFSLPPEPVQTGYSFAGWWTKPSGGLQVTADTVFIEGVYRRLYAHWVKGHWVFLDPNGGTVTNDFVTYVEQTVYGVLPAAVRTGYAFGGWRYKGRTVLPTTPIETGADHTLTAQWEAYKYSVKFNANGGEGEMDDLEMTYDEDRTLPANSFRRNGYAFLGWAGDGAATGADYADVESVRNLSSEENGVVELFAVWKKDGSNVTLDSVGDAEWAIDTSVMHDGAVAWKSGAIGDDQNSVLRTTVIGKGKVSFYWKVDCEWFRTLRLDSLSFSVDGQEILWINGEKDWMHVEFDIAGGGEHVLEWTYAKDGLDDDGDWQDCGWVSEVTWIPVLETLNDYLNCTNLVFGTSGDAVWFGQREVSHDGFGALRSGAVGDNERSRLDATVNGPVVVSFWWKTDCEASYRTYVLDHLAFYVDGEEKCFINGDSGWVHNSVSIGEGQHTISWVYEKDEEGAEGEDCAWLDEVRLMPAGVFPAIVDSSEVAMALAGTVDEESLAAHITTKSEYDTFRSWVDGKGLSHAVVRDAPNAWLSYALDAPGLMAKAASLANEDVVIESIEPSSAAAGAMELVVNIADAEIGEGVTSARLAEALGVEGATELSESAFSTEGLSVTLERTADGKAKATIAPDGAPPAFFMRVKVK